MDQPHFRRAGTLVVLIAAVLTIAACGSSDKKKTEPAKSSSAAPASASPQGTIAVTENEYSLKPTPLQGKAGKVTFDVKNAGDIVHEFIVIKTDKKADALSKGSGADDTGKVDEVEDIQPGKSAKLAVTLKAGHYALICNLPGHYMPGGKPGLLADFTVR